MTPEAAQALIKDGVPPDSHTWADIGAGTGTFTIALQHLIDQGVVYAMDKNPHVLWNLETIGNVRVEVCEYDFNQVLEAPPLDGLLLANTLHYAQNPEQVLSHILPCLKDDGTLIIIEYETDQPLHPWIPFPIPFAQLIPLATKLGLAPPVIIGRAPTRYGHQHMYSVAFKKAHH